MQVYRHQGGSPTTRLTLRRAGNLSRGHQNTQNTLKRKKRTDTEYLFLNNVIYCGLRLKCDGTRAETRFRFSAKRTNPFKSAGASIQSTTGSRGVSISGSNDGYTMFRGCVKGTGYPLHLPVSPSLPLPCVTVSHHFSTGLYQNRRQQRLFSR